ncbi:TIGR00341 family protein [Halovenus salina]|uniref:TIGR00341 family protein n=1 Tax=Halovenus salina TaxID=1510225 RepID=UPI002260EB0B|nr:TIGR00341 family protein [Halovenus salina]
MRLVQVIIPSGKREALLARLDDDGIDYVVTEETSGREFDSIAYIPLPTNAVEPTLDSLREAGLGENTFTVVLDANTVVSRRFEALQEEYAEEQDEDRIARDELVSAAASLAPSTTTYAIMTVVSAVVATAGLLLDSAAVVVGSMVIAPLVGPALSASVGTVVNDSEMFRRGVRLQAAGLVLAILSAFAFAFLVRQVHLIPPLADVTTVPEVQERVAPDFLMLAIAIGAGVAGIVSLTSGVSAALVGVMIAVALIPPAATVGIGLAWGQPQVSLGAGVLLLVNVLSINLASLVVLWYKGYRPKQWFYHEDARNALLKRGAALVVAILVLSAFLGGVTFDSFQRASTEDDIRADAAAAIEAFAPGQDIDVLSVEIEYPRALPFQNPDRVVVTVGVPPGESASGLATLMRTEMRETTGTDLSVEVRYIQTERG